MLILSPVGALAAETAPPADAQQIEQLQRELATIKEQMAALQKTIDASRMPADQQKQMMGHMGMMQQGWHGMHGECCKMSPGSCPAMGAAPPKSD